MNRRTLAGLVGAVVASTALVTTLGSFLTGDVKRFGIGLSAAARSMLGERLAERLTTP